MDDDIDVQMALNDFARTRRIRMIQLILGSLLIFALGFLAGASFQNQGPTFTVDLPAAAPPEQESTATRT
jgi:hypothetical protein